MDEVPGLAALFAHGLLLPRGSGLNSWSKKSLIIPLKALKIFCVSCDGFGLVVFVRSN